MQSMTEKMDAFAAECSAAMKSSDFAAASRAAVHAAESAEILSSRTSGAVAAAYAKTARSWRDLAEKLSARKCAAPAAAKAADPAAPGGGEWLVAEKPSITFDDIAGMEDAKRVIREMVLYPMQSPEKARALGLSPGGGVLLFGPPGTGKTMLGKAIAGALDAPFYYASGADLRSKWYGESEQRLSKLFAAAKSCKVAVVFLDEVESLLPKRTAESHAADNRVVTQFLSDVGGFKDSENLLLVLGATNKPWAIDEAVFRTGRFDEKIYIGPPDAPAREKILELNLKGANVEEGVDAAAIARSMEGASGSDVAAVVAAAKRAALGRAVRSGTEPAISAADFVDALSRIPSSITPAILAPYAKFMEERF